MTERTLPPSLATSPQSDARWPRMHTLGRGVEWLAYILDSAIPIPGTKFRIGLDPILGLLPGAGDAVGGALSLGVIFLALQHRVPMWVIARMVANVAIDAAVGGIPIVGDLLDFGLKANQRNLNILKRQQLQKDPTRVPFSYWIGAAFLLLLAMACIALPIFLLAYVFTDLVHR